MVKAILERMFMHWKTSAAGVGVAALYLGVVANAYKPGMTWHDYVIAAVIAAVGLTLKDPGKMASRAGMIIIFALAWLPVNTRAQAAPIHTFSTTSVAASLPGLGRTVVANITEPTLTVTKNVDLKEVTLLAPGDNFNYFGGGFNYRLPMLSTKLNNASPNLNGLRFQFSIVASAGVGRFSDGRQHIGFTAGGRVSYDVTQSGMFTFGGGAEYAKLPGLANNTWMAYAGPAIHF